jgi:hypothetical protein
MVWFFVKWGLITLAVVYVGSKLLPQVLKDWIAAKWNSLWSKILKK